MVCLNVRFVCFIKCSLYIIVGGLSLCLFNISIEECCEVVIQYEQIV